MKLSFISKVSTSRRTPSIRLCHDRVAKKGAFSIEYLMSECTKGHPLPMLKNYSYTPDGAKDLRFSSIDPKNLTELFLLGQKKMANDAMLADYNAKVAKETADAEFQRKVDEGVNAKLNDMQKSSSDSQ